MESFRGQLSHGADDNDELEIAEAEGRQQRKPIRMRRGGRWFGGVAAATADVRFLTSLTIVCLLNVSLLGFPAAGAPSAAALQQQQKPNTAAAVHVRAARSSSQRAPSDDPYEIYFGDEALRQPHLAVDTNRPADAFHSSLRRKQQTAAAAAAFGSARPRGGRQSADDTIAVVDFDLRNEIPAAPPRARTIFRNGFAAATRQQPMLLPPQPQAVLPPSVWENVLSSPDTLRRLIDLLIEENDNDDQHSIGYDQQLEDDLSKWHLNNPQAGRRVKRQTISRRSIEAGMGQNGGGAGGNGPSLSIVNPLDVLRQRLILELNRRKLRQSQNQIEANSALLKSIGKKRAYQGMRFQQGLPDPILISLLANQNAALDDYDQSYSSDDQLMANDNGPKLTQKRAAEIPDEWSSQSS